MLSDNDKMSFGKYAGDQLINVPASYLMWLYDQMKGKAPNKRSAAENDLVKYIDENMEVLKKEMQ